MSRYLKLIWFAEDSWTKYHAAVGINAEETLCGIIRSTRAILPSEKMRSGNLATMAVLHTQKCLKCRATLRKRYETEDITEVKVG